MLSICLWIVPARNITVGECTTEEKVKLEAKKSAFFFFTKMSYKLATAAKLFRSNSSPIMNGVVQSLTVLSWPHILTHRSQCDIQLSSDRPPEPPAVCKLCSSVFLEMAYRARLFEIISCVLIRFSVHHQIGKMCLHLWFLSGLLKLSL